MMVNGKDIGIEPETYEHQELIEAFRAFNFKDFIVISRDSAGYHIFKIFVIICGSVSSLVYAFFAAFRKDINSNLSSTYIPEEQMFDERQIKVFNGF